MLKLNGLLIFLTVLLTFYSISTFRALPTLAASTYTLFVATNGNDAWSGLLNAPNPAQNDGPFATIDHARQVVAARKLSGNFTSPINIEIRAGTYHLNSPLTFNTADSGTLTQPILYEAYNNEAVVLSGGKKITGSWTPTSINPNIFKTHIQEVSDGIWNFSSLYVNDLRSTRARLPATGFYQLDPSINNATTNPKQSFTVANSFVNSGWTNLQDIEVVDDHRWQQDHQRLSAITSTTVNNQPASIVSVTGYNNNGFGWDYQGNDRYYFDNVFEGLTGPNQWYLDRHTGDLYYWPSSSQNLSQVDIEAPITTSLVQFQGQMNRIPMDVNPAISVSSWIKTAQAGPFTIINNAIDSQGYSMGLTAQGKIVATIGYSSNAYNVVECNSSVVNDNAWHFLTSVFDRNTSRVTCYVDGVAGTPSYIGIPKYSSNQNSIPSIVPFNGAIDEFYVYNRGLTASDVQTLYQLQVPPPSSGNQVGLNFENNLQDSSVNGLLYTSAKVPSFVTGIRGQALSMSVGDPLIIVPNYSQPVHNITLSGLHFTLTDEPLQAQGFDDGQALASFTYSPMVRLEGAENITITGSILDHGSGYGIEEMVSKNNVFTHNTLDDLGGGGIGSGVFTGEIPSSTLGGNIISDNTIYNIGKYFAEGTGIIVTYTGGNSITHNRIHDVPYTAISLSPPFIASKKLSPNIVEYNDIHDAMQQLTDGAGIYTSQVEAAGSHISFNVIHDIQNTNYGAPGFDRVSAGVYLDEISQGVGIANNLVYRTGSSLLFNNVHGPAQSVDNNIFVDGKSGGIINSNNTQLVLTHNIFYDGTVSPPSAPIMPSPSSVFSGSDNNLFYPAKSLHLWDGLLASQQANGFDLHSQISDPLFKDYAHNDFTLLTNSSARGLGFIPFDLSSVGPRALAVGSSDLSSSPPLASAESSGVRYEGPITLKSIDGQIVAQGSRITSSNRRPIFRGNAAFGTPITVTVHSDPLSCSTSANVDTTWSCSLTQDLPVGNHTVEVSSGGKIISTYNLTILAILPITGVPLPLLLRSIFLFGVAVYLWREKDGLYNILRRYL